jgi:hypothetical protein
VRRICVDMDEVIADTLSEHLRRYNQEFDESITPDDLAGKGLWEVTPHDRQQQLRAFLDAEDFFEDLPLIPGAQDVLKALTARFEIVIATSAMAVPNSLGPKYRWLQRHFSFTQPGAFSRPRPALLRAPQHERDGVYARERLAAGSGFLCHCHGLIGRFIRYLLLKRRPAPGGGLLAFHFARAPELSHDGGD